MAELLTNFRWALDGSPQEMLIEDGWVTWRRPAGGSLDGLPDARDLGGAELVPGFIDAHCHILPTGLDFAKLHLGHCTSREAVLDAVAARHSELAPGEWLLAVHYDQTRFGDGVHLTSAEIDRVVPDRPVLLRHMNGHAGVANKAALKLAGIGPDEPNPSGGTFVRDESGTLTGVLLERALDQVARATPEPNLEEMVDAILAAGQAMHALGITCATDMMTGYLDLEDELTAYRVASERGCPIRIRLFLQWSAVLGPKGMDPVRLTEHMAAMDPLRCRIVGLKIFADGAIASATAAIYGGYAGQEAKTSGQLIYSPERLTSMVRVADEAGWRIAVHSIGDYSSDLVMDAFRETGHGDRHRIEHAMILSDDQIARLADLGCHVTMQPEFLVQNGKAYQRQLGPERASRLKRARSVLDAGIPLSFSSDRPIVPGSPVTGIAAATRRPDGFDQSENVTREEAILAYTLGGAIANGDEGVMGSLDEGQVADWTLLPV